MPSKGNPIVKVRLERDLIERIEFQIASRNATTAKEPWTLSDFLRVACWEKLLKMQRSRDSALRRAARKRKRNASAGDAQGAGTSPPARTTDNHQPEGKG